MNWSSGEYRNHSVCPSVHWSVCAVRVRPISFFALTLAYHIWKWCVAYIQDPDTMFAFDMALYCGFFVLWHSHTIFGTYMSVSPWDDMSHTFMTSVRPDLWHQFQNNDFTVNLCLDKTIFALWHRHIKFGTSVCHHETTCCVRSWPLLDLGFWPICGWWGISLALLSFELVYPILKVYC